MAPLWILRRRQWRIAAGLAIGTAALLVLSFIAGGRNWPANYLRFLTDPANNPYPGVMPNLHGMMAHLRGSTLLEPGAAGMVATLVWLASRDSAIGIAAALVGGILTAPHAYMHDCALLIPAILIVLPRAELNLTRYLGWFLLTPVPYVLLLVQIAFPLRAALLIFVTVLAWEGTRACGDSALFHGRGARHHHPPRFPASVGLAPENVQVLVRGVLQDPPRPFVRDSERVSSALVREIAGNRDFLG